MLVQIINELRMNKLIASSVDPKQLSLTVKGILVSLVVPITIVLHALGKNISQDELSALVELITNVVAAAATLVSTVMMLYGSARKFYTGLK